jgi:uncharacterized protein YPO0396
MEAMRRPWNSDRLDDLSRKVDHGFAAVEQRFKQVDEQIDERFKQVDKRFKEIDDRFNKVDEQIDERFKQVEKRFNQADVRVAKVDARLDVINERLGRLEGSIDNLRNIVIGFCGTATIGLILSQFA